MPEFGTITDAMRSLIGDVRLGFVATVNDDGTPNLSPKGTIAVWDDHHVVFADIRSPRTVRNLRQRPAVEISVIDSLSRRGYRFRGTATIVESGPALASIVSWYRNRHVHSPIRHAVLVRVSEVIEETSPAYDVEDANEDEIRARYARWYSTRHHDPDDHP
jgi:predicted pyridoxine 5'-phosphate oxidase superfamily flavin-nucleotide-binding protein